jgi:general secretion pathway protein I
LKSWGFTLLEVMVAVAILGLSLTVLLSAQAGLYAGGSYAQHTSVAIGLARCRMTELEERLLKLGYPLVDEKDEGPCCADDDRPDMRCSWEVDTVELPEAKPPDLGPAASAAGSLGLSPTAGAPGSTAAPGAGPLAALSQLTQGSQALSTDGGISGIASALQSGTGGAEALAPLVMSFVYPRLKPLLEASIRKVSVKVTWREGVHERDLSIVQYVTRPTKPAPVIGIGADGGTSTQTNPLTNPLTGKTTP